MLLGFNAILKIQNRNFVANFRLAKGVTGDGSPPFRGSSTSKLLAALVLSRRKVHTPTLEECDTLVLKVQPFIKYILLN